jgi:two-component system chemotaxis sensor kinase CheA
VAAGKPEIGVVELSAYHEHGHIVINVKDDGGGIDPQKLRTSFTGKGLISKEAANRMSDSEALDLIFMAGASTKEEATELSGRGVGMDIVKKNVEAINGFVDLQSELGSGTTMSLRLPLTLATVQSILVYVSDVLCAIPLVFVLEAVKLQREWISTVQGREVFKLRDKVIPLVDLAEVTGLRKVVAQDGEEERHVVVVRIGERLTGVVVDSLLEPQEIVVKSLGKYVGDMKGVTGASILGDGRVVLILDVGGLVNSAGSVVPSRSEQPDIAPAISQAA